MNKDDELRIKNAFAKYSPCFYHGSLPCEDCGGYEQCDLYYVRIAKQKSFEAGWLLSKDQD